MLRPAADRARRRRASSRPPRSAPSTAAPGRAGSCDRGVAAAVPAALHPHLAVRAPLPPHIQGVAAAHRPRPRLPPRRRAGRRRRCRHRRSAPASDRRLRQHRHPPPRGRRRHPLRAPGQHRPQDPTREPRVSIGQRLGVEGSTGTSTGFHLHFQVEINGRRSTRCRSWPTAAHHSTAQPSHPAPKTPSPTPLGLSAATRLKAASGSRCPHPAGRGRTRCTTRRCPSRPRSKSCTSPQPTGTRSPGRCWPASAWKKPGTAATTTPAPPAPKG